MVWALSTLRPYLMDTRFTVNMDHSASQGLMSITEPSGRLMHWRHWFDGFDYEMSYRKVNLNAQVDA